MHRFLTNNDEVVYCWLAFSPPFSSESEMMSFFTFYDDTAAAASAAAAAAAACGAQGLPQQCAHCWLIITSKYIIRRLSVTK